jgi:hypothetical protein
MFLIIDLSLFLEGPENAVGQGGYGKRGRSPGQFPDLRHRAKQKKTTLKKI